jgi:hypothetical protein
MDERVLTLAAGIGVGAGLMYLLDPQVGRRRRARVRDQAQHFWNEAQEGWDVLGEDVRNRATGWVADARSRWTPRDVDDRVLCERVRSHLGRVVSHPRAIEVTARDGLVTLSGPILVGEVGQLLRCVRAVPGVKDVEDRLQIHRGAENLSALQGGRPRPGPRWELFQDRWSPTTRLLVTLAGGGLLAYGFTQHFPLACVVGSFGLGLMASGLTNRGVRDLVPDHLTDWLPEPAQPASGMARGMAAAAMGVTGA